MKKLIFTLLFGVFATADAVGETGGFEDDYVWQERFQITMSKAESGQARAQYSLGEMFENGRGTHKDIKQAFTWYQKASVQSHLKAQYKIGYMYYKGLGVQKNNSKAYKYLSKPANKGNVRAQFYLGKLYDKGQGVGKDPEKALLWYSRSSLGGFSPAEAALKDVKKYLALLESAPGFSSNSSGKKVKAKSKKSNNKTRVASKKSTSKSSTAKKAAPKKVAKLNTLSGKILDGSWMKRKKPAEFLPSNITRCKQQSSTVVECVSGEIKRNIGNADIIYITKAILFGMKKSGEFSVAYRNNVLKINKHALVYDEDDDDEEGASAQQKVTVKKGWQDTEHKLECKVNNKATINCVKNKTRKLKFSSKNIVS